MKLCFPILSCLLAGLVQAGQFNDVLSIGDPAPRWKDLAGIDGDEHSLDALNAKPVVVVVFTCNSCPYAVDVEDRLNWLYENYSPRGVELVVINVNTIDADQMPAMKERAEAKSFRFDYLFDPSQQIAKQFGAKNTPEFFVLGRDRKIAYMGAMDDSPDGKDVGQRFVAEAIDAVLEGKLPEITETVPIGCLIRFERERRTRRNQ